jgi:proline dehydrogenase
LIDRIVTQFLKASGLLRYKAERYVAGLDPDSAINRTRHLNEEGYLSCITLLKTARNEAGARANATVYQRVLDLVSSSELRASLSLSLSQFAFAFDHFLARELVRQIVIHAVRRDVLVWIDTSQGAAPELNLELARDLHRVPGIQGHVGITIDANLYRAGHDLSFALHERIPIRLRARGWNTDRSSSLRGASQIRNNYRRLTELLLTSGIYCSLATRDSTLIKHATGFVVDKHLPRNFFDFELPDGVNEPDPLMPGAWNIRYLVPFGQEYESYVAQTLFGIDRSPIT